VVAIVGGTLWWFEIPIGRDRSVRPSDQVLIERFKKERASFDRMLALTQPLARIYHRSAPHAPGARVPLNARGKHVDVSDDGFIVYGDGESEIDLVMRQLEIAYCGGTADHPEDPASEMFFTFACARDRRPWYWDKGYMYVPTGGSRPGPWAIVESLDFGESEFKQDSDRLLYRPLDDGWYLFRLVHSR